MHKYIILFLSVITPLTSWSMQRVKKETQAVAEKDSFTSRSDDNCYWDRLPYELQYRIAEMAGLFEKFQEYFLYRVIRCDGHCGDEPLSHNYCKKCEKTHDVVKIVIGSNKDIIIASADGKIYVLDGDTYSLKKMFRHHKFITLGYPTNFLSAAVASNGDIITAFALDSVFCVWDNCEYKLQKRIKHKLDSVRSLGVASNGDIIAVSAGENFISIREQGTLKGIKKKRFQWYRCVPEYILSNALVSNGDIVLGAREGGFFVWNADTSKKKHKSFKEVRSLAADDDIFLGDDSGIKVIDAKTYKVKHTIDIGSPVRSLTICPNGDVVSASKVVSIWDRKTFVLKQEMNHGAMSVAISANEDIISGFYPNNVRVWRKIKKVIQDGQRPNLIKGYALLSRLEEARKSKEQASFNENEVAYFYKNFSEGIKRKYMYSFCNRKKRESEKVDLPKFIIDENYY